MNKTDKILTMFRQIDELNLLLTTFFSELNDSHLTTQQEQVLVLLKKKEKWTTTEMAEGMSISKSAISQVVKVLEKEGFVKKEKNQHNLRETFVSLDSKGIQWSTMIDRIEYQLAKDYFSILDEADLDTILNSFQQVINRFSENKR